MLFGAVVYLLHLHSILCFIETHSYHQWLLSEVSSNMIFIHGSHSYLIYVILPGWNQKNSMLLEHLGCKITLNRCCAVWSLVAWTRSSCPLPLAGCVYLPWFICHFRASQLKILWHSSSSHVDTSCQLHMPAHTGMAAILSHWCWPERSHTTKTWMKQNSYQLCCCICPVLWAGLGFALLSSA